MYSLLLLFNSSFDWLTLLRHRPLLDFLLRRPYAAATIRHFLSSPGHFNFSFIARYWRLVITLVPSIRPLPLSPFGIV